MTKYKNVGPGFWCDAEMGTSEAQAWFVPVAFLVNFFIPITTIIVCYTKINRKIKASIAKEMFHTEARTNTAMYMP